MSPFRTPYQHYKTRFKMGKRSKVWAIVGLIVLSVMGWRSLHSPSLARWRYRQEFDMSKTIIEEVEAFYARHNQLPSEQEVALLMKKQGWPLSESCPCYQILIRERDASASYMVWFGYRRLGTSMVYRSDTQAWQEEG